MKSSNTSERSPERGPKGRDPIGLVRTEVARRVKELAVAALPYHRRKTTNLYLEHRVLAEGEIIGPKFEPVRIERPSVLVFADHEPHANYSHNCQFLLFDPQSGRALRRIGARFPPYEIEGRGTLRLFHAPVPVGPGPLPVLQPDVEPCPVLPPIGRRYAILFAGVAQRHHVNDLELCYRTLTGRYGFDKKDVFVLCHSGHMDKHSGPFSNGAGKVRKWPNDDPGATDFTLELTGAGTTEDLAGVFAFLKDNIAKDDLLFIHTNGHGSCDASFSLVPPPKTGSFLCTWAADNPNGGKYYASELKAHLASIGTNYRALLVLAQQCNGGGFKDDVLSGSTAQRTSIDCAAEMSGVSWWASNRLFTHFSLDWLSAQRGALIQGTPLDVDGNHSGAIEASEAYCYAKVHKYQYDTPNFASAPNGAEMEIAFSDPNPLSADWCVLVEPMVNQYRKTLPEWEYYPKLHNAIPKLRKVVLPVLKKHAGEIRKELVPKIADILAGAFGGPPVVVDAPPFEETKESA